jgi:hypothetical protein
MEFHNCPPGKTKQTRIEKFDDCLECIHTFTERSWRHEELGDEIQIKVVGKQIVQKDYPNMKITFSVNGNALTILETRKGDCDCRSVYARL